MNNNILFYSDKCQYSMLFIKKLQDEDMLKEFRLINVLELKTIPSTITNIPTIVVKNINIPLSGISAFDWLENSKYFYQKTNNVNNKVKNLNIQQDTTMCIENNHHKKTDDFANLNDADDDKITKIKFNGASQNVSITNTENIKQKVNEQKIKPDIQNQRLNELLKLRNQQFKNFMIKTKNLESSSEIK